MYKGPIPERYLAFDYESESINRINQHCCEKMQSAINCPEVALSYSPRYREYFLPVLYKGRTQGRVTALQGILHCPWCNKLLPSSLRDEWFDILEQEYNLEDPWDDEQHIPKEFITDEWWIKRKL